MIERQEEKCLKKRKLYVYLFSNKHTCQKKWFCSFISIRTLMRCVRRSHPYIHCTHWYSSRNILVYFLLIHLPSIKWWWWSLNEKNKSMALMTDTHTHKCRQESIEWSMSHPKRSLTGVAFTCGLAIVIIRAKRVGKETSYASSMLTDLSKITHAYQGRRQKIIEH